MSERSDGRVSVVIPTFNHAHLLGEAIASVLAQTRPPDEVIVVDDGSADDVAGVVAGHVGVRLLRQPNRGLASARNTGLRACSGDYVLFLDADDRLVPDGVQRSTEALERDHSCMFVYGRFQLIDAAGAPLPTQCRPCIEGDAYLALLRSNPIGMHGTVLYRRAAIQAVGGFRVDLAACEDYELYLRMTRDGPIGCHDAVIAEYRQHGENMSADPARMLKWALHVLALQELHVRGRPDHEAALAEGRALFRAYYGGQLVRKLIEQERALELRAALRSAAVLARYDRSALRHHIRTKLAGLVRRGARAATGARRSENGRDTDGTGDRGSP